MHLTIPTLHTDRLVLRAPNAADFEGYAAILASPRARFLNGPYNRRAAWKDYCLSVAEWVLHGVGPWAITLKDRFVGLVGLSVHPDFPEPEMGWVVSAQDEGKGFAFEAASAVRDAAFTRFGLATLVSYIWPENTRAHALAERLGGARDDMAAKPWPQAVVYRYAAPQQTGAYDE